MTAKLPRFANLERAMTPGEFAYGRPATVGQYVMVNSDQLKRLLDRVYELERLEFAVEQKMKVDVAPDGGVRVSVEG